ncbi:MAG TPA: dihydrofolate reductase, partial [Marinilabiliaceae bacterium]|nr:dihydrofolate reductase [Marinilabiliaceae bacterium]
LWLSGNNRFYCDSNGALGNDKLLSHPKVYCMEVSSGRTSQAFVRLSEKVLANIRDFLKRQ